MSPVPATYRLGPEPRVSRHRHDGARTGRLSRACGSLLIWSLRALPRRAIGAPVAGRAGVVRLLNPCKFLFFPRRVASGRSAHRLAPRFCAAMQHLLVNINENTSAAFSTGGRPAPEPTEIPHETGDLRPVHCNTRGGKTSPTTSEIQAGTRGHGTRGGPARRAADAGPCRFLFFHARTPRSEALRVPTGGRPPPAPAIVNPCSSLLIARISGPAEPVRSGDRPVRRHGLSFPPPPPSPREESGERP
jgi:hypothetical protein